MATTLEPLSAAVALVAGALAAASVVVAEEVAVAVVCDMTTVAGHCRAAADHHPGPGRC